MVSVFMFEVITQTVYPPEQPPVLWRYEDLCMHRPYTYFGDAERDLFSTFAQIFGKFQLMGDELRKVVSASAARYVGCYTSENSLGADRAYSGGGQGAHFLIAMTHALVRCAIYGDRPPACFSCLCVYA